VHPSVIQVVIDLDRVVADAGRPEEAGPPDPGLEVVNLRSQVANGACEEVNSDEPNDPHRLRPSRPT
jgi:hypothetical protein